MCICTSNQQRAVSVYTIKITIIQKEVQAERGKKKHRHSSNHYWINFFPIVVVIVEQNITLPEMNGNIDNVIYYIIFNMYIAIVSVMILCVCVFCLFFLVFAIFAMHTHTHIKIH